MRCQYCGKNLWPLRGLFDEDFCSKDHRQRYNERVRKALDHLPKVQASPRPIGIAGFQFEKPRVQEPQFAFRSTEASCENQAAPAIPEFAHANPPATFATGAFTFASPQASSGSEARATDVAAAVEPKVMSIESLRDRFQKGQRGAAAAAMIDLPMSIAPQAGNMALKASHRWDLHPEVFDELNHVYLHEPDPALLASLPVAQSVASRLQPIATTARARHTAAAGPSGAGRVEFFPMQPFAGAGMPGIADVEGAPPQAALQPGQNIWLEDPVSWNVPVSMAPTRSSLAMLPAIDRAAALEQFRDTFSG